ncbi:universal stress protein [Isoptericola sp. NEAU-Y5]|uniref:Universal stress protein n=1 Tax=Isoptericola luteus TaxID=2879484 RepID=A0ABS7ZDU8_9MICO|nr:universal stress protein [Isoptericola sp. NEAU-Y5]MCA5892461.1 universal stress protein [Isoptericola sp. NEAU-Y5]
MTVLVAYNPSPHGEAALRTAIDEAARRRAPLHVVALAPPDDGGPGPLEALLAAVPDTVEVQPVTVRPHGTEPADLILDTTERTGAVLVVIGSRKRSSTGTFLMGTTTQRVLLDSPVPVLVVKDVYDA